ncbi:MAG: undecaprenyl/decaprenyl-phosphate alpha-N-acetylglucosaminyl 1-phosphate transferase, partial [Pedobacter sp.]
LVFNYFPAKIFMGDTGSLIIGLVCVILAIKFIELNKLGAKPQPNFYSAPAIAVAVLIIPIFDSLRIFFIRLIHKKSPFKGDRNHVHHRLQRLGFTANQIVLFLASFNLVMVVIALSLQHWGNFTLITIIISICVVFNTLITFRIGKNRNPTYKLTDVIFNDTFRPIAE